MTDRERQFADAAVIVDDSLVMRVVAGSVAAIERAIVTSKAGRVFQARRAATLKGSPYKVLTLIATGCVTHMLLLQLMPDRIAPVKPLAYGMVLAFGAFAAVAGFITTRRDATAIADSTAGTANARKS